MTQINQVDFETGDFTQCISHTGAVSVVTSPTLAGAYCCKFNDVASVGNFVMGKNSSTYGNSSTLYFACLFKYDSLGAESGFWNLLDQNGANACFLHISSGGKLIFYDYNGVASATGATALASGTVYTIAGKFTVGLSGAWEIRINNVTEISGTNNIANGGATNMGGANYGGGSPYTRVCYFDQCTIDDAVFPYPLTGGQTMLGVGLFF